MRLARTAAPLPRSVCFTKVWLAGVEPAVSCAQSRRGGRLPYSQLTSTPGGARTRSFRVESPASSPLRPRGHEQSSGGRARTCALAGNSRASSQLDHAGTRNGAIPPQAEGEGVEPPRPEDPPVFETGYRAGGSPSEGGSGRRRTCAVPGKNRALCRLSYGAVRATEPWDRCDRQGSNLRRPAFQASALPC